MNKEDKVTYCFRVLFIHVLIPNIPYLGFIDVKHPCLSEDGPVLKEESSTLYIGVITSVYTTWTKADILIRGEDTVSF